MYLSFACCESKGTFLRQERRKCLKICLVEFLCVADVAGWIQLRATAGQVFLQTSSGKSSFLGLSYVQSPAEFRGSGNLAFSYPWSSINDVYWWISAQVPSFQQSASISCGCSTLESALRTTVYLHLLTAKTESGKVVGPVSGRLTKRTREPWLPATFPWSL